MIDRKPRAAILSSSVGIMLLMASFVIGPEHTRFENIAGIAIAVGALMVLAGMFVSWRADRRGA